MAEDSKNMPEEKGPFADETLLARWLAGDVSEEERREVVAHPHFPAWERIANTAAKWQDPAFSETAAWDKLVAARQADTTTTPARVRHLPRRRLLYAAAAIGLLLISAYFLLFTGMSTVSAGTGEQLALQLPDGSTVTLNAGSQLRYPKRMEEQRSLELTGEAFFQVTKGGKFQVQTNIGTVEVLGTSFNVNAHPEAFRVDCYEGRVKVTGPNDATVTLTAGKTASLEGGKLVQGNAQLGGSPGWTTGETKFTEASLKVVFGAFERQFGLRVIADDLPGSSYSGPMPHADPRQALQIICPPMKLRYTFQDAQTVLISKEEQ